MTHLMKQQALIECVMTGFPQASYQIREQACDEALAALSNGKSLQDSMKVAKEFIETH